MTIGNFIGSFKDNIEKKVKNPFFSTLAMVVVAKNWQLFYSLFYFDSTETRETRIGIIEQYITNEGGTVCMLLWAILWTFGVLLISYLLQIAGTAVANLYDARINTKIIDWATKGAKTVTKTDYDILNNKYKRLDTQLEEARTKKHDAELAEERVGKAFADYRDKYSVESMSREKEYLRKEYEDYVKSNEQNKTEFKKVELSRAEKIADKIYNLENWNRGFITLLENSHTTVFEFKHTYKELYRYLTMYNIVIEKDEDDDGEYLEEKYHYIGFTNFGEVVREHFLDKIV